MKSSTVSCGVTAFLLLALASSSLAQGIALDTHCRASFATLEAARQILTNRDDFISALSPFDRAARMKTDRAVTEKEFLEFAGKNAVSWLPDETNRATATLQTVRQKLSPWNLPSPAEIPLIKTSGLEEGNASYTRQNAILIAQKELRSPGHGLEGLIIHELFHVLSRQNPDLRARLYGILGFARINEIPYPGDLAPRKITNPDGVQTGWAITVTNQNESLAAVPILFATTPQYDLKKGGEFFDYLTFKLLVVSNQGAAWAPKLTDGKPRLLDPPEAKGFLEQIGGNTDYIIHPDEILAVNFVHMVNGETNLATPRIVDEMRKVLRQR